MALYYEYTGYTGKYYCTGGTSHEGVEIWLNGSNIGYAYRLVLSGSPTALYSANGTGGPLNMGIYNVTGTYFIQARLGAASNWTYTNIELMWRVIPLVRTVTGGGVRYDGDPGLEVGLNSSGPSFIYYDLYKNGIHTGSTLTGTLTALTFGTFTDAGIYTSDAHVINTSTQYKSINDFTVVTAYTYKCYTNMSGSTTIYVYPSPLITTNPITHVQSVSSYSYMDNINIPITYTIQSGSSISQFKIEVSYDYTVLKYVNYVSLISDAIFTHTLGNIIIEWNSVMPALDITKEVVILVFNYKIGDTEIRISDNTFYKFYARETLTTIKENGYVTLADDIGSVSAYKSIMGEIGAVLYASKGCIYDIYFNDMYYATYEITEEYARVYEKNVNKITIKGNLNNLTRLDLSNNDFEFFEIYNTDLYRLNTLNLQNNKLINYDIPKYTNSIDLSNNEFDVNALNKLFKKCYETGMYNATLDIRNNGYIGNYNYYDTLILKGWNIRT